MHPTRRLTGERYQAARIPKVGMDTWRSRKVMAGFSPREAASLLSSVVTSRRYPCGTGQQQQDRICRQRASPCFRRTPERAKPRVDFGEASIATKARALRPIIVAAAQGETIAANARFNVRRDGVRYLPGGRYAGAMSRTDLRVRPDATTGSSFAVRHEVVTHVLGTTCHLCVRAGQSMWWRKGWDSNPRYPCRHAGFQDRFLKPLGHPSKPILSSA